MNIQRRIEALETERAGLEARGLDDRVKQVDADLAAYRKDTTPTEAKPSPKRATRKK